MTAHPGSEPKSWLWICQAFYVEVLPKCLSASRSDCWALTCSCVTCPLWVASALTAVCLPLSSGQVQSKRCIEEVLHFAYEENLLVMADEVSPDDECIVHLLMRNPLLSILRNRYPLIWNVKVFRACVVAYVRCICVCSIQDIWFQPVCWNKTPPLRVSGVHSDRVLGVRSMCKITTRL